MKLNIEAMNPANKGKILKFRMGFQEAGKRLVEDPEIKQIGGFMQKFGPSARRKATPFLSHRRIDGYLKGKKAFVSRVRYAKKAWKHAPGRAAMGLGKMGAGVAIVGASTYFGINALKRLRSGQNER